MNLIRGLPVDDALNALRFTRRRGASIVSKVLRSALANAEHQGEARLDELLVSVARVDNGPMLKRLRPRARGMAFMIRKRVSHAHIGLGLPGEL